MHFTYNENLDKKSLCQGDVLIISDDIKTVLTECHPYFLKSHYKYFIVLTQSCDLVRRGGKGCKSPYITLAAVRSYDDFIDRTALSFKVKTVNGIRLLEEPDFDRFKQLIERVYNNNESEHFFLVQDADLYFNENMVAYLKVSFALKSDLHYEKCLDAKVLELSDEFKAKLGWLVGEMYSRVGTKDWDCIKQRKDFLQMVETDLKERFIVSNRKKIKLLEKNISDTGVVFDNSDTLSKHIDSLVVKSNYEEIMDLIQNAVENQKSLGTDDERQMLIRKIKSITKIKTFVKE